MKLIVGIILVAVAAVILVGTYFPLVKNEIDYHVLQTEDHKTEITKPIDEDFGIVIDKLGINSKVIKNVNPYDAKIYQKSLTQGVAHAEDTSLPGEKGNIFIFSHSSENFYEAVRYNSIFYLLNKLKKDDRIKLFYNDREYNYIVLYKQVVSPDAVNFLEDETEEETLTLMTCWPPGTSLKRLIIRAVRQ